MTQDLQAPPEQDRRAAFRRGRILTAVVVGLTAAGSFIPAVFRLFIDPAAHHWSDFVVGPILFGLLTWFALRGERYSTGCLTAFYGLILSGAVLTVGLVALVYFAPQLWTSSDGSHPQLEPLNWHRAPGFWENLGLLAVAAQVGFAMWVLVLSKDARFYRTVRRRGVNSADDPAFANPVPPPLPGQQAMPLAGEPVGVVALPSVDPEAFRRGKILTITVVVVTAVLCLWPEVRNVCFGYPPEKAFGREHNVWVDLVVSSLILGTVSWGAWRGGRNSTGCLAIFYTLGAAIFVLGATLMLVFTAFGAGVGGTYQDFGITIKGIGHDLGSTVGFVALGAWTVFSYWVLVRSLDARAYRHARQGAARATADSFNEWHQRRP